MSGVYLLLKLQDIADITSNTPEGLIDVIDFLSVCEDTVHYGILPLMYLRVLIDYMHGKSLLDLSVEYQVNACAVLKECLAVLSHLTDYSDENFINRYADEYGMPREIFSAVLEKQLQKELQ